MGEPNGEIPTAQHRSVQGFNGIVGGALRHIYECEALRSARSTIQDDGRLLDFTEPSEQGLNIFSGGSPRQVADVDALLAGRLTVGLSPISCSGLPARA